MKTLAELPHNLEAENAVLSAMICSQDARVECLAMLSADDFFKPANRVFFDAIKEMDQDGKPVDEVSLIDSLRIAGKLEKVGGEAGVIELSMITMTLSSWEYHAGIVLRESARRKVLGAVNSIAATVAQPPSDTMELISKVQDILLKATERVVPNDLKDMPTMVAELDDNIRSVRDGLLDAGIMSDYVLLDRLTNGFQPGQLIVIGARPAIGKTSFALNLALNMAGKGTKVCLFSLEMSSKEIAERFGSMASGVVVPDFRAGLPSRNQQVAYEEVREYLKSLPIDVDDTPGLTVNAMRAKARRALRGCERAVIIVDYLQLIEPVDGRRSENRNNEIGAISRALKIMAKKLGVPIIALAQLSRAVEQRVSKRPILADLRESGSIEQDADIVMFLDRSTSDEEASQTGRPAKNEANLIVAKNRQGPTGDVRLAFLPATMKFYNLTNRDGELLQN